MGKKINYLKNTDFTGERAYTDYAFVNANGIVLSYSISLYVMI